jgi:hypothetical protein
VIIRAVSHLTDGGENQMKQFIRACAALIIVLAFASIAMAQNARVLGQVMDTDGKP